MKRRWMPLDIPDYLSDTRHLSTRQHGAYLLLIMHYWQAEELPEDDRQLARIAGLSPKEWAADKSILRALFGDRWRHKRVDAEIAKATEIINKRKAAGQEGANKRYGKEIANATDLPKQSHTPLPLPLPRKKEDSGANAPGKGSKARTSTLPPELEVLSKAYFDRAPVLKITNSQAALLLKAHGFYRPGASFDDRLLAMKKARKDLEVAGAGDVPRALLGGILKRLNDADAARRGVQVDHGL